MSLSSLCRRTILWSALLLGLSAPANAETLQLAWDANVEPGITGYTVAYGTRTGVYTTTVNVGNVTSYTLNLTTPGTYFFAVSASSPLGTSAYSAEVSTTITSTASNPVLVIDGPTPAQVVTSDAFLTGWSADLGSAAGSGVDAIHVYAYPNPGSGAAPMFLGAASYGTVRGDVGAAYGAKFLNSGFSLPIVGLTPGRWDLVLFAHSTVTNTFAIQRGVPVTVGNPTAPGPRLNLDMPRTGDNIQGALTVAGWAVDQRATSGTGVNGVSVWAYPDPASGKLPIFLGDAAYGAVRADVGNLLGTRFRPSGFELTIVSLAAGVYDIVAFPRSTVSGAYENPRVARVTLRPSVLVMVDRPSVGATVGSAFTISGWSLDRRATANNGISVLNVWAYKNPGSGSAPVWVGGMNTVVPRADVAAVFGAQYGMSGYTLPVTNLSPGVYDLVVFAQSSVTGQFENATVVRITVQ